MARRKTVPFVAFALILLIILVTGFPRPAGAVWHVLLNERFEQNGTLWPWGDWEINPNLTWSGG